MKKRGRPRSSEVVIKRSLIVGEELWEWALNQSEGANGLIRRLLEQERHAQVTRRVLDIETPAGMIQAISNGNGMIIMLEDDAVMYFGLEEGQSVPVMKIPALPGQILSVSLYKDQILILPLKPGQILTLPTPVKTLQERRAETEARRKEANQ